MGLMAAHTLIGYMQSYRVLWLNGRYGGGKTALAYRIAYDLIKNHGYRYLLSNIKSVWDDDPASVVLRDGVYVDAVFILDEGGLYLENGFDAKQFLAFLRKLNIVLIVPSVMPPARQLQILTCQRMMNFQRMVGLPLWMYRLDLSMGKVHERDRFYWWNPSEIWGVYDTLAFPEDDAGLSVWIKEWIAQAKKEVGYVSKYSAPVGAVASGQAAIDPGLLGKIAGSQVVGGQALQNSAYAPQQNPVVDELRRAAAAFSDASGEIGAAVSLFDEQNRKKRRR